MFHMIRDPYLPEYEKTNLDLSGAQERSVFAVQGEQVLFQWNAPEYIEFERSRVWIWGMLGVLLLLELFALFSGSFVMALSFLIFAYIYYRAHNGGENKLIVSTLTERGITYGDEFYEYGTIKHFYLVSTPESLSLHLVFKTRANERVMYLSSFQELDRVRTLLSTYVEEVTGIQESLMHRISRLLKL